MTQWPNWHLASGFAGRFTPFRGLGGEGGELFPGYHSVAAPRLRPNSLMTQWPNGLIGFCLYNSIFPEVSGKEDEYGSKFQTSQNHEKGKEVFSYIGDN